jgi:hypothetical protein
MKWLVILAILVAPLYGATPKPVCSVSDFVEIAYSVTDPKERKEKVEQWLNQYGGYCSKEQLLTVYNGLATSLGTSDTMRIRTKIELLYERIK